MNGFEISTDASRLDVTAIHAFLSKTYWSPGIPLETVRIAIGHSVCVGAYRCEQQVGFARAITDHATFAYLADVYVLEAHRGQGLSRRMVQALTEHGALQGLRRMLLITRDAHGLYAKFGFKALASPDRFMELHRPQAYAGEMASATSPAPP
jgi:GNAT superfamily N-acetyltransferase